MRTDIVNEPGGETLPRKKTDEQTWLSVRVPLWLHEAILRSARKDDRTASAQARRLMEEALRTRGEVTAQDSDDDA